MFKELDWKTRVADVSFKTHRRVFSCVALGSVIGTILWYQRTPHAFWFMILWGGLATGSLLGLVAGLLWQLKEKSRWAVTSGKWIVVSFLGWASMALLAAVAIWPALQKEEDMRQSIRALSAREIAAIELDVEGRHFHHNTNAAAVTDFIAAARSSELFYPSHEISILDFEIRIHFNGGAQIVCQGSVPERHVADVALKCPGSLAGEILIPGGRQWLDGSARTRI